MPSSPYFIPCRLFLLSISLSWPSLEHFHLTSHPCLAACFVPTTQSASQGPFSTHGQSTQTNKPAPSLETYLVLEFYAAPSC